MIERTESDIQQFHNDMARIAVNSPDIWFRIDKGNGSIIQVQGVAVVRAAMGSFKNHKHAIATGRFATNFAIYCTGSQMTADERATALGQ